MRELKFRAWDGSQMLTEENFDFVVSDYNSIIRLDEYGWTEHWVDCVEQYTGLKDKNGREIYEGDLIKVSDAPALKDKTLIVEFGEYYIGEYACTKMFGWLVRVVNSDWTASLLDEVDSCEVIGNIHENPELLKEKE